MLGAYTTRRRSMILVSAGLFAAAAAACGLGACDRGAPRGDAARQADRGDPFAVYTTRGRIVALPDPKRSGSQLEVEHEAIDDFKECSGRVVGMSAMIMPFPLARGVSLDGLGRGDVVEITFAVWCEPRLFYEATSIRKLPADTPLEFRAARPPESPSPPAASPDGEPHLHTGD